MCHVILLIGVVVLLKGKKMPNVTEYPLTNYKPVCYEVDEGCVRMRSSGSVNVRCEKR